MSNSKNSHTIGPAAEANADCSKMHTQFTVSKSVLPRVMPDIGYRSLAEKHVIKTIVAVSAKLWWRRMARTVGFVPAVSIIVIAVAAPTAYWLWVFPAFRDTLLQLVGFSRAAEAMLAVMTLISYSLVVAIIRSVMLAADSLSKDLRLLLATAPLTRVQKGMAQFLPDWLVSVGLSLALGSIIPVSLASVVSQLSVVETLAYCLAITCVVGMLATAVESLSWMLLRSVPLARATAALVITGTIAAILATVTASITASPFDNWIVDFGLLLLSWEPWGGVTAGAFISIVACAGWLSIASVAPRRLTIGHFRRIHIRLRGGSLIEAAAMSFWREPANRLGASGVLLIVILGIWVAQRNGMPVSGFIVVYASIILVVFSALTSYGAFTPIAWRVRVSPMHQASAWGAWVLGQLVAAAVAAISVVGLVSVASLILPGWSGTWLFSGWTALDSGTAIKWLILGITGGLAGGRIIPYREGDMFSMGVSGLVSATVVIGLGWLTGSVSVQVVPQICLSAVFLVLVTGIIAVNENRRHGN